jgi:two-component system alkaline phosphatase synthesis response regulator PhoP
MEALTKARLMQPDLIVLDVMMEGMDGLSVCEILRAQPRTRGIPVIIVTAATGEIARVNSFGAGAADFLSKPFSPGDLLRRVSRLLDKSTTTQPAVDV